MGKKENEKKSAKVLAYLGGWVMMRGSQCGYKVSVRSASWIESESSPWLMSWEYQIINPS